MKKRIFPSIHRKVPRLLDQSKSPACSCYALCMAMEERYLTLYNQKIELDPEKLFKSVTADGRIPHLSTILTHAKSKGVWDNISRNYIKIDSFSSCQREMHPYRSNIIQELKDGNTVLISLDLGDNLTFKQRTHDGVVERAIALQHSVVGIDCIDTDIIFANPWGEDYGIKGYGMINIQDGVGKRKTVDKGYLIQF